MKSALVVASALALGARTPQNKVSYRTDGANLVTICAELSKLTGDDLKVSAGIGKEILAIRVADVDPADLERKVAEVVHGSWVDESGSKLLKLDPGQERRDQQRHQDLLAKSFQRALDSEAKALAAKPIFDAQEATGFAQQVVRALAAPSGSSDYAKQISSLSGRSPSHRAVSRLLATFQPSELAQLPVRIRVVYSNDPNASQRPLSDAAMASAEKFVQEQTFWSNEAKAALAQSPRFRSLPDFLTNTDAPKGAPSKLLVGLYRESEWGRVRIDLKLADSSGKIICQAKSNLKPQNDPVPIVGLSADQMPNKFTVTNESLQIALDGFRRHPMSDQVRQDLLSPMVTDPLGIGYGNSLTNLADRDQINLVADLSDQLIDGAVHEGLSCTDFEYLDRLSSRGQSVRSSEGWLTIAPDDLSFGRAARADRGLLQEYVRGETQSNFPLERQAACAVGLPDPLDNYLPSELVSAMKGRSAIGLQNVALLRFFGSLSEEDLRAAESDHGVGLAGLSAQSIQFLNEVVFGEMASLIVGNEFSGVGRDPTECLAGGYAPSSSLSIHVDRNSALFDLSKDKLPYNMDQGAITPGEIAFMQYSLAHPDRYPEIAERAASLSTPSYCSGTYSRYRFLFKLASDVSSNGELDCRSLDDSKPMSLADLPSDLKAQIDAQYAQIEKDEKAAGAGAGAPARAGKTSTP